MNNPYYLVSPKLEIEGVHRCSLSHAYKLLRNEPILGLDTENSSLDCHEALPLLLSIGTNETRVVLDTLNLSRQEVKNFLTSLEDKTFILANAKYDYKVIKAQFDYELKNIYDVMIAEQSIRRGLSTETNKGIRKLKGFHKYIAETYKRPITELDKILESLTTKKAAKLKSEIERIEKSIVGGNSLDKIIKRYCNVTPKFDKSTRDDFINASTRFKVQYKHVIYSADDVGYLHKIKEGQDKFLAKYGMKKWVYEVEFPLISILGKAEVEGIPFNATAWKAVITENIKARDEHELELDSILRKELKGNIHHTGGRVFKERRKETLIQGSMFGVPEKEIKNLNKANVNYNSTTQVKDLFRSLGIEIPTVKDADTGQSKESVGIEGLENLLKEDNELRHKPFIEKFITYKKIGKEISSFGESYLKAISSYTGNIHTIYRQNNAETGRFQSGGGKHDPTKINSQQIPAHKKFRTCFGGDPKYWYITLDLSGAELVVLASLANDKYLASILDDPHSPLASAGYNNIISYILNNMANKAYPWKRRKATDDISPSERKANRRVFLELKELLKKDERVEEAYRLGKYTITKDSAKDLRNGFKAVIYGLAYGATDKKIAETLRIPVQYAKLIVEALADTIPNTFNYLKNASKLGKAQGYITLSNHSKNRRWFYKAAMALQGGDKVGYKEEAEIERACKNSPIQGTQADMVKEATVALDRYFVHEKIDARILMLVHDEWFIRIPRTATKEESIPLADEIKEIILNECNKSLTGGLKMEAEYTINDTWVK
jgi:DNA polymerase I-like protein with 3'-5' exonuclease and polymerase domains